MSKTETSAWHDVYRACSEAADGPALEVADAINRAVRLTMDTFAELGFEAAGDDNAERLVSAVTAYFFESNLAMLIDVPGVRDAIDGQA